MKAKNREDVVSVIVPVYNNNNKINRCIKSICDQSYTNLEIIIVDDGSDDSTPTVCRELAKIDKRIMVVRQCNRGQAMARKNGVLHSHGEYIVFVDSDDYILNNHVAKLVEAISIKKCDIVRTAYTRVENGKQKVCKRPKINSILSREEALEIMLKTYDFATPVAQIVKRKLFDDSIFSGLEGIKYAEDYLMNLRLILKAKRIYWSDISSYIYEINKMSTSMNGTIERQVKNARDAMYVYSQLDRIANKDISAYRMFHALVSQIKRVDLSHATFGKFSELISEIYNDELFCKYISFVKKSDFSFFDACILIQLNRRRTRLLYVVLRIRNLIRKVIK